MTSSFVVTECRDRKVIESIEATYEKSGTENRSEVDDRLPDRGRSVRVRLTEKMASGDENPDGRVRTRVSQPRI